MPIPTLPAFANTAELPKLTALTYFARKFTVPGSMSAAGIGVAAVAALLIGAGISVRRFSRRGKFEVWAQLLTGIGLRGDERVLDLGCGRGAVLLTAAKLVPRGTAVGVDIWRADQTGNSMQATLANAEAEGVAHGLPEHHPANAIRKRRLHDCSPSFVGRIFNPSRSWTD